VILLLSNIKFFDNGNKSIVCERRQEYHFTQPNKDHRYVQMSRAT